MPYATGHGIELDQHAKNVDIFQLTTGKDNVDADIVGKDWRNLNLNINDAVVDSNWRRWDQTKNGDGQWLISCMNLVMAISVCPGRVPQYELVVAYVMKTWLIVLIVCLLFNSAAV